MSDLAGLAAFVTGLIVGGSIAWLARGDTVRTLREHIRESRIAEALATDRLVHAWKEGAQIAPRPTPAAPPLQPLPKDLADHVNQWDDPEHKAMLEADIRARQARGLSSTAILMALDNEHP